MSGQHPKLVEKHAAGIDLLVREGSTNQTIVLLHGIGGRASSFAEVMMRWPSGPQLIAWDAPGYGGSDSFKGNWPTPADYAKTLANVCDAIAADQIDLMGQSLGALIAGTFAATQPQLLRRLILMSPAHGYKTKPHTALPDALAKRIIDFDTEGPVAFATKRAPRLVHDSANRPGITDAVRSAMSSLTNPGHTHAVRLLGSGDLMAAAQAFQHPTLVINGRDDIITPLAGTEQLYAVLQARQRGAQTSEHLAVVPDAGHAVYLEAPDTVAKAASDFFGGAA